MILLVVIKVLLPQFAQKLFEPRSIAQKVAGWLPRCSGRNDRCVRKVESFCQTQKKLTINA